MHGNRAEVKEILQQIVPIRHGIHGVLRGLPEAELLRGIVPVQRIGGSRKGTGSQRALIEAVPGVLQTGQIPAEHLAICAHMMRQCGGLGLLEMGEARHIGFPVFPDDGTQLVLKIGNMPHHGVDFISCIQLHVQGHLVIPGASRMQTLARLADPLRELCLHKAVDILGIALNLQLSILDVRKDTLEARHDGIRIRCRDDALLSEHPGMHDGSPNILLVHPLVKAERLIEGLHQLVCFSCKSAAPKLHFFSSSSSRSIKYSTSAASFSPLCRFSRSCRARDFPRFGSSGSGPRRGPPFP